MSLETKEFEGKKILFFFFFKEEEEEERMDPLAIPA